MLPKETESLSDVALSYEQSLHQYLYQPLSYIDSSWLKAIPLGDNVLKLDGWRYNSNLNQWLISCLSLGDVSESDFSNPARSIALLPTAELKLVLHYLGATLHSQACKAVVLRQPRQVLLANMGEEAYQFCLTQTQLLLSHWPTPWVKPLPEVITSHYFQICGLQFVMSMFEPAQREAMTAWQLKLPYEFKEAFSVTEEMPVEQRVIAYQLIKKISKRVIPKCFHLLR
ncbi:SctK family type III secretion system sorting platform protein [Shewanella sp. SR44-3]|uniref:SctK family type III secretion system sorting platform protein n=1 Tax=unclassified Shewanella TaxID=196818 RepID=UPI0015FA7DD3|nr:SctK family type III secretion system sorting platform protein [Shewanella sp. SR44-3]MBB1269008.1 SctK family type III secretion system sorting platform protein [Shewanella sp. SR44-3]